MTLRPLAPADIRILRQWQRGYPYPHPAEAKAFTVVADGKPIAAAGIFLRPEVYLWCAPDQDPRVLMTALRLLHEDLAKQVKALGYNEVDAQLPPEIAEKFGRRLERSFGWVRNEWRTWFKRL